MGVKLAHRLYAAGVASGSLAGFLSPWRWLGFVPLAAGLVWAAYDLVEVNDDDADAQTTPR